VIPNCFDFTDSILNQRLRRIGATLATILALCAAAPAAAQTLADYDYENLSFRGIGFDYGHVWPNKVSSTPTYSVRADLGFLGPGVRIVPSLTYWSSSFRGRELNRLADQINRLPTLMQQGVVVTAADLGEITWRDLSLALDAQLLWTTPAGIITYVGAGGAVHALNGAGEFIRDTFVEDGLDSFSAGVAVMAGAEAEIVPQWRVYGEVRYTLANDVRYPGLRLGAAWMLPANEPAQTTR
jgi:opacity protein-like surface antigen